MAPNPCGFECRHTCMKSIIMLQKLILTTVFLFVAWIGLMAQDDQAQDVIYHENGSVFQGTILSYEKGGKLEIQLDNDQVLVFDDAEIVKIMKTSNWEELPYKSRYGVEKATVEKSKKERVDRSTYLAKGFFQQPSFGIGTALSDSDVIGLGIYLNYQAGYQFNRWLGISAGSGFDVVGPSRGENLIPVFGEIRMYPFKNDLGAYFAVAGGYNFALENRRTGILQAEDGYLFHPSIGYRWTTRSKAYLCLDLGYRRQTAQFTSQSFFGGGDTVIRDYTFQRTTLRLTVQWWAKNKKKK